MSTREYSRIIIKRSTELGVQPTIPVNEEFSNEWNTTDLFVGELFMNTVDDRLWTRTNNGIVEIPMSGISSENFYTDSAYILSGTTLAFDRTNATGSTLAYTVDLAPMFSAGTVNTYLTGGTLSGSTLKLTRNDGVDIEVSGFNSGSGSTFDCSDLTSCEVFNNLSDKVDALQSGATDTGVILTGITEDISLIEADILTNSGKIAANEGNISGLTSNIIAVNQDIGDLTGRVSNLEASAPVAGDFINGSYMFNGMPIKTEPALNYSKLISGYIMFGNSQLTSFSANLPNLINAQGMFTQTQLTSWTVDLPNLIHGRGMFSNTQLTSFTADLSNLVNGYDMFINTPLTSFTADLSSLENGYRMFQGCTINTTDYSNLLISLEANNPNNNVTFHGGGSKYNASAVSARAALVGRGWTITDGGPE